MARAPATLSPWLALSPGAAFVRARRGHLRVRSREGDFSLGPLPTATASALQLLQGRGAPEDEVLERASTGGQEAEAHLHLLLRGLARRGLLRYAVHGRAGALATLEPLSELFELAPGPPPPEQPLRLSRFAYVRRDGEALVLESPRVRARVHLAPAALPLLAALAAPTPARDAAGHARGNVRAARALVALLARARLLVPADAEGNTEEERHPALRLWEFHDLLFHTRTRRPLHGQRLGATHRLAGHVPPLPAILPPRVPVIPLPRPDLDILAREDSSFACVLERRRSERRYGTTPLTHAQLGELLFRAARVRELHPGGPEERSLRPAPSAGALHPLEIHAVVGACEGLAPGLYRYEPLSHGLEPRAGPTPAVRALLADARQGHSPVQVLLVLAARFQRVSYKYEGFAYACLLKDAGVLLQTLTLAATAMGLASCIVGWSNPDTFERAALTPGEEETPVAELVIGSAPTARSRPGARRRYHPSSVRRRR
ncbi:SagB family peptide dehydrogenase [Myxococcus sp. RHSTA-1-4]|uniref:SagB family peptide dehydrogenase n=1 Tax=Myxococcus sp. RHSTA-1-4 TaxID=2874601 RepID=UPI00272E6C6E|nr:SagB family peptide dehydrogenase [Myxococcus sp. RHSTA-1-4]MBZ4420625.1 SagB family peptide dehydrogenase [Myxococcus sp. RHSTA-1-4]